MKGQCNLCKKQTTLRKGHVIPSFAFKWLKDTSGTGFLRHGQTPNLRAQDGIKKYLVCEQCEQLFSVYENEFKNKFFLPLSVSGGARFPYRSWLLKFAVSLSWRVLLVAKQQSLANLNERQLSDADRALDVWGGFLLGNRKDPDIYQQHIVPFDMIESATEPTLPPNINSYIMRAIDMDVAASQTRAFVFTKICRVLIIGFITEPRPDAFRGTMIHVNKGTIGENKRYRIPTWLISHYSGRAKNVGKLHENLSDRQWEVIQKDLRKNIDRYSASEQFRATRRDVEMFGDRAFVEKKQS
jgi:hypothetical protein